MADKATTDDLNGLHNKLTQFFAKCVDGADTSAAMINAARAFLKDNGIEADGLNSPGLNKLATKISELEEGTDDSDTAELDAGQVIALFGSPE